MNHGILDSPCIFCGYCAAGYYQPNTHNSGCPWREVGGLAVREMALRGVIKSALARLTAAEARVKEVEGKAERWERAFRVRCIQADERDSEISDQFTLLANAEREARTRAEQAEARVRELEEELRMFKER